MTKKTTRKKQHIQRKLTLYLAVAAASLITAGGADAAVIYQQNLDQDFGVGAGGDYELTMEGTSADLRFFGAASSGFGDAATYSFSALALGNAHIMVAGSDVDMLNTSEFVNDSMGIIGASGTFYYYDNNGFGTITTSW